MQLFLLVCEGPELQLHPIATAVTKRSEMIVVLANIVVIVSHSRAL